MTDDAGDTTVAGLPTSPSLRWTMIAVATISVLLLATLIILFQRSNGARDQALVRTQHSYDVVMLTSEVAGSMARAEAALGRFVIDGDRRTGTMYTDEWRHAGAALDRLGPLISQDPAQVQRLQRLRRLYDLRNHELGLAATRANFKQGLAALSLFARAGRSNTLPQIDRLLDEVATAERRRLDQRSSAAATRTERANDLANLLSAVGALLALSVLALGWLAISSLAERRVARETADIEADRSAALERAVEARTAELREANRQLTEAAVVREQAEARLRQVQKMDAIGQLTGGIAHDFNNMLAVVLGGLELARRRVDDHAAEAGRHIDNAMEGATRAAALTRRLLSFARAEPLLPSAVDAGRLLIDLSNLIDRTIGERIEVRIERDAGLWPVWIDPYQLENAMLNLAVNARDAMNGEGTLIMRASNVVLGGEQIGSLAGGDYVRIAVVDDGSGMDATTLERVFEPFFTTKPAGQGTGLGLSQILGFARQSEGDVAIESTPGIGTTVSIYLPRHVGVLRVDHQSDAIAPRKAGPREEMILVVEDDPRVRAATGAALTELGYHTILCESGPEAIAALGERSDIHLVITDVVMPGMSGPELVAEIETRFPDVRVLFVTGYVGDSGDSGIFAGHAVLRKPFTLHALAERVAETLPRERERPAA
jgi:signal transduction histidine kinase/CheY-like chemotaxis protein